MRISDWSSDVCSSDLDDRHIGVAEGGVEVIAEGVELTDHLARQMRLGDGARAQHRPERIAAAGARRSCRQAFEHRDRIGDRLDRHPARRLAHGRPAPVDGRSDEIDWKRKRPEPQSPMRNKFAFYCWKTK